MPLPLFFLKAIPIGRRAEIEAAMFLRRQGYLLLACPFRVHRGEVDIVARDGNEIVFVEVKARRGPDAPESAVTLEKRRRLILAAREYLRRHRLMATNYRFDVIAVQILDRGRLECRLIRDAFREDSESVGTL